MPVIHGGGGDLDVMFFAGDEGSVFLKRQNGIGMVIGRVVELSKKGGQACLCMWPRLDCSSLTYICCRPTVLGGARH